MTDVRIELKKLLKKTATKSGYQISDFVIEEPKNSDFGDLASNIAIILSKKEKKSPSEIAEKLIDNFPINPVFNQPTFLCGFLNFHYKKCYLENFLQTVLADGDNIFKNQRGRGKKVLVEYVSANPTGQLHIGNARGGPIGETIARLYQNFGFDVNREFYVNDFGVQIDKFARTLNFHYQKKTDPKVEFPEGGYRSVFIEQIFNQLYKKDRKKIESFDEVGLIAYFQKEGISLMIKSMIRDLESLGIKYDKLIYESEVLCSGKTDRVIELLKEKKATVVQEGALWFKNSDDPGFDDRESVLVKSDDQKSFTYFANDIAYHLDKFERGYFSAIDIWGANHHGHIPRIHRAIEALGIKKEWLKIILYQNVRVKEDGRSVQMSKRFGNMVNLSDLFQAKIAGDVFNFMILMHDRDSVIDFDVELAKDQSEKNPVYSIKYAYARICSLMKKAGVGEEDLGNKTNIVIESPEEIALLRELVKYPAILEETFTDLKLQRLPHFALKIASRLHHFYDNCRVIGEEESVKNRRLKILLATKTILGHLLDLMAVEAPEKM